MRILDLALLILSAVCFALATFNTQSKVNLLAAGLLAWVLVPLITLAQSMAGS